MKIELNCTSCSTSFSAPPEAASEQVMDEMFDHGPSYALGDGETFEDMIFTTLTDHGQICCPNCGDPVTVSEESLGRMAMEVLAQW